MATTTATLAVWSPPRPGLCRTLLSHDPRDGVCRDCWEPCDDPELDGPNGQHAALMDALTRPARSTQVPPAWSWPGTGGAA